jgi:hypothetical protein
MPLATGAHTVLVFKEIQFPGNWTRWSGTQMIGYTANGRRNQLLVVVESATGVMTTFFFIVPPGLDVWIVDDVVHIPVLCVKSVPGRATKCQG